MLTDEQINEILIEMMKARHEANFYLKQFCKHHQIDWNQYITPEEQYPYPTPNTTPRLLTIPFREETKKDIEPIQIKTVFTLFFNVLDMGNLVKGNDGLFHPPRYQSVSPKLPCLRHSQTRHARLCLDWLSCFRLVYDIPTPNFLP